MAGCPWSTCNHRRGSRQINAISVTFGHRTPGFAMSHSIMVAPYKPVTPSPSCASDRGSVSKVLPPRRDTITGRVTTFFDTHGVSGAPCAPRVTQCVRSCRSVAGDGAARVQRRDRRAQGINAMYTTRPIGGRALAHSKTK